MNRIERIASLTAAPCGFAGAVSNGGGSPSGPSPRRRGSVLDQQRQSAAQRHGKRAERQIRAAPAQHPDQERGERRHRQCADANSAHGKAGGKAAPANEPSLYRADRRHIGAADAKSYAEPVGCIDLREALRRACGGKAEPGEDHAGHRERAGTEAIRQRTANDAEAEIEETGKRKYQRHRAARGAEIALQRFDDGAEGVGGAEADERHRERGGDDKPAIEDPRMGHCRVAVHVRLLVCSPCHLCPLRGSNTAIKLKPVFLAVNQ
jgi:hypothetical protein